MRKDTVFTIPAQKAKNQPKAKTQNLGRVKLFWVSSAWKQRKWKSKIAAQIPMFI